MSVINEVISDSAKLLHQQRKDTRLCPNERPKKFKPNAKPGWPAKPVARFNPYPSANSSRISGPARRSLDRFVIQAISPDGTIKETDAEGNPLVISGDETLVTDTSRRIYGTPVLVPA